QIFQRRTKQCIFSAIAREGWSEAFGANTDHFDKFCEGGWCSVIKYLLDSNIFIQAKNMHYPFESFPGFWSWLRQNMEIGVAASIEPVFDEIMRGNDELADWTKERKDCGCFLSVSDTATQQVYRDIAAWAVDPARIFKDNAKSEFLRVADSWLVAKAVSEKLTVVTLEKYQVDCKKRILIPNVCRAFGVECIDTVELIRRTGVKFDIAPQE
ncbi:DUF4411 family protein, partial [bacterium]